MTKRLNLLVLCGGPSSEHEVSLKTAQMVLRNLDKKKYNPSIAIIKRNGKWKFPGKPEKTLNMALQYLRQYDFVFIAMHGSFGEDGHIQALLEWTGIPYSGSNVLASSITINKQISNELFEAGGLHVPEYTIVDRSNIKINLRLPLVLKPIEGGSSIGVTIVKKKSNLRRALTSSLRGEKRIMVQKYIQGREMTCGVLENGRGEPFALPPTEIIPKNSPFFDYRAKYKTGGSAEITPPQIPPGKIKELQNLALKAHKILGCTGMSRSDFILTKSGFSILETNTIPGMTETSLLPQEARAVKITFPQLLDHIIAAGLRRR